MKLLSIIVLGCFLAGCQMTETSGVQKLAIGGWVKAPGVFPVNPTTDTTVSDLVTIAGGLGTPKSNPPQYSAILYGDHLKRVVMFDEWHLPLERLGIAIEKFHSIEIRQRWE